MAWKIHRGVEDTHDLEQVGQGGRRDFEFHFSLRTRAAKAFLEVTGMASPASSWA